MGLCGNFTWKILQLHTHVISPLPFFNRDENTCFGWNPKSKRLVFLGASALHVKFILVELMLAKH